MQTPWGNKDRLRERQLPPGPGAHRDAVRANQRDRLFAATIALVAEHGYEATTLVEISQLSGVSRGTFYEHFADKRECFLAAVDAMVALALAEVEAAYASGNTPEDRFRRAFDRLAELMIAQPAAARVWFVETYALGPAGVERHDRAASAISVLVRRGLEEGGSYGERLPEEIEEAIVGGLRWVLYSRLRRGEEGELPALIPELLEWALGYRAPPTQLRRPRQSHPAPANGTRPELNQAERILRAVSECVAAKGYAATSVSDVATRAACSMRTFYAHFENKEQAFLAMIDWGNVQVYAASLPAFNRGPDWAHSVRNALHAVMTYLSYEPALARAGSVEIYAAGAAALDRRDAAVDQFQRFLEGGYELRPDVPTIAAEAIGGAVDALLYRELQAGRAAELDALAPTATYIALAPFIGAEAACEIANSGGQPRRSRT